MRMSGRTEEQKMSDPKDSKELSFEEKLQIVQELTEKIESGALPLEDAVREYERGMKILGELDSELGEMNRRLSVLQNGKETVIQDADV